MTEDRLIAENALAYAIYDKYPVTDGHLLVIPKRHADDYFGLTTDEVLACDALVRQLRAEIQNNDSSVEGFNLGMNAGEVAGQTVFHCHIHLIPVLFCILFWSLLVSHLNFFSFNLFFRQ